MGRPARQSKDAILHACRDLFWQQGYARTSMKDIEQATGLKSGSLYHQFNGKQHLFNQTLNHYIHTVIRPRVELYLFTNDGDARENIEGFFQSVLAVPEKNRYGCLMVNTSIENPHLGNIQNVLIDMLELLETGFLFQLKRINDAKSRGWNRPVLARQLTLMNQGFWSMVRIHGSDENVKNYLASISHLIR